ncbi:MAG: GntR family transcriptional regulator [Candidatus Thermoplasmatota archaeon]|jgi:DNA-binding GntR family transcriptional regulator|nr:GntR family transcriptional regulator [Candidatus Thermoplasmatota archaeon]
MESDKTLTEMAYKHIFDAIMSGRYRSGQSLSPDSIVAQLNISKTPVREALVELEAEGIISRNGRYYNVIFLDQKDILDLYELRAILESEAAALACERVDQNQIQELKEALRLIREAVSEENPEPIKLADLNGKYHALIAKASGNRYLAEYTSSIRLKLKIIRTTLFTSYDRRMEEVEEHEAILSAIERGDSELARARVRSHMFKVINYLKNNVLNKIY